MPRYFDYRGGRIAYNIKGNGRTIVFLHGFLGDQNIWSTYLKELKTTYRVLTIDLPGHGLSDTFGYVHQMEYIAELLNALLKHCHIRKCILVGHSMGGYIAMAFAELYPDKVLGMMLMNSTAQGDNELRKKSREQLIRLVKRNRLKAIQQLVPSFFKKNGRGMAAMRQGYLNKAKQCSIQGIVASVEGMKLRKEREIVLKFAPFPFVLVAGKLDEVLDYKNLEKQSALSENGSFVLLENSSHMSVLEEKQELINLIKKFGRKLSV